MMTRDTGYFRYCLITRDFIALQPVCIPLCHSIVDCTLLINGYACITINSLFCMFVESHCSQVTKGSSLAGMCINDHGLKQSCVSQASQSMALTMNISYTVCSSKDVISDHHILI